MFASDFGYASLDEVSEFMLNSFYVSINTHTQVEINLIALEEIKDNIQGIIWGGNLAMLCSIIGTKYFPEIKNGILFIEDINEPPYKIERLLHQLYQTRVLQNQQAILFGNFSNYKLTDYDNGYTFKHVIQYWQEKLFKYDVKIFTDLKFGHCKDKATIPFGAKAKIMQKYNIDIDDNINNYILQIL